MRLDDDIDDLVSFLGADYYPRIGWMLLLGRLYVHWHVGIRTMEGGDCSRDDGSWIQDLSWDGMIVIYN